MAMNEPAEANEMADGRGRRLYRAGGCACVGVALVGTVLPLLPTTPFLLLAAWLFSKSSPQLRDRLYRHPRFGPLLRDWQEEGAIPIRAKVAALGALSTSWLVILLLASGPLVPSLAGLAMAGVGTFIATRPDPRPGRHIDLAQGRGRDPR